MICLYKGIKTQTKTSVRVVSNLTVFEDQLEVPPLGLGVQKVGLYKLPCRERWRIHHFHSSTETLRMIT